MQTASHGSRLSGKGSLWAGTGMLKGAFFDDFVFGFTTSTTLSPARFLDDEPGASTFALPRPRPAGVAGTVAARARPVDRVQCSSMVQTTNHRGKRWCKPGINNPNQ
jgi:hypothetical protein